MSLRRCIPVLTTPQAKECQSSKYYRTKEKISPPIVVPTPPKSLNDTVVTAPAGRPSLLVIVYSGRLRITVVPRGGRASWLWSHHGRCGRVWPLSSHCRCRIYVVVTVVFAKFAGRPSLLVIVRRGRLCISRPS